jgi:hypothetical protein
MAIKRGQSDVAGRVVRRCNEGKMMCDEASHSVCGVEEVTKQTPAAPLPAPSKETKPDLPEVIPDLPNAPIL